VIAFRTNRWHRFRPEGKAELAGDGQLSADGALTLWTPSGPRKYRGALRAASPTAGATYRNTVNVLSMDDYVKGVVPYEMPASWSPEAVKAQAVAARTYATWSRNQYRHRYYQICDTSACQVYGGASGEDPRSNAAVDATRRQILTYGGKPAFTQFSSSDGGWTSDGGQPYLPAQADPYDGWSGNPVHDWTLTIDAGRLESAYPALGRLRRVLVVQRDGNGDWQGRVESMVLDGTKADVRISGDTFRWEFGLRSDWFSIQPTPIISRWTRIGGDHSELGAVRSAEYPVDNGSAQAFDGGRIYYSSSTGARELYGPILARYRKLGGPGSTLGLPTSPVRARGTGFRAMFENGAIYSEPSVGTVALSGPILDAYRAAGGVRRSGLGWPTEGNCTTRRGARANFQDGYIVWVERRQSTRVVLDTP
jgi:SpoIID/LytB domain protein